MGEEQEVCTLVVMGVVMLPADVKWLQQYGAGLNWDCVHMFC